MGRLRQPCAGVAGTVTNRNRRRRGRRWGPACWRGGRGGGAAPGTKRRRCAATVTRSVRPQAKSRRSCSMPSANTVPPSFMRDTTSSASPGPRRPRAQLRPRGPAGPGLAHQEHRRRLVGADVDRDARWLRPMDKRPAGGAGAAGDDEAGGGLRFLLAGVAQAVAGRTGGCCGRRRPRSAPGGPGRPSSSARTMVRSSVREGAGGGAGQQGGGGGCGVRDQDAGVAGRVAR